MNQSMRRRGSKKSISELYLMSAKASISHVPISFSQADLRQQHYPHNDPLVIRANISKNSVHFAGNDVGRILVDNGSSTDILIWQYFVKMGVTEKDLQKS